MRKLKQIIVFLVSVIAVSGCSEQSKKDFSCYNVNFGDERETVMATMENNNFHLDNDSLEGLGERTSKEIKDFKLTYSGAFFTSDCLFGYWFEEYKLKYLFVYMEDIENHNLEQYNIFFEDLKKEYGNPDEIKEYDESDGAYAIWEDSNICLSFEKGLLNVMYSES